MQCAPGRRRRVGAVAAFTSQHDHGRYRHAAATAILPPPSSADLSVDGVGGGGRGRPPLQRAQLRHVPVQEHRLERRQLEPGAGVRLCRPRRALALGGAAGRP